MQTESEPVFLLNGDPHIHSTFSDGALTPKELLQLGAAHSLDFIALADHNTTMGAAAAKEETGGSQGDGPYPIWAQELSTEERLHILVIGVPQTLGAMKFASLPAVLKEVDDSGGAAVMAHPWSIMGRPRAMDFAVELLRAGLLHGVELASAAVFYEELGRWRQSLDWYREVLAAMHPAVLGGSDWHDHGQGFCPGLGRTIFLGRTCNDAELTAAIRNRRTAAFFAPAALIEHGLMERVRLETTGMFSDDGDGLFGDPEVLADLRRERQRVAAAVSALPPSPIKKSASMLLAAGAYAGAAALAANPTAAAREDGRTKSPGML